MIVEKANRLLELGYQVIPVTSDGKPLVRKYLTEDFTKQDVKDWIRDFPDASLALVCGKNNVYALDFDVDNVKLSKSLQAVMRKYWPKLPIRSCNPPRFACVFRAKDGLLDINNGHSIGYKCGEHVEKVKGKTKPRIQQVEVLGGKLITLLGLHRKSGNKYRWGSENPLLQTYIEDLPELDDKDIKKIFRFFEARVPGNFMQVTDSTFSQVKQESSFENAEAMTIFSDEKVEEILEYTDGGESREKWINVGMALHENYRGSKEGLRVWDQWSSQFDGYEGIADCRREWKTFKLGGGLTMRSLVQVKEKKTVASKDVLQDFIDNVVVIEKGKMVGDLRMYVNESLCTEQEKLYATSHIKVLADHVDGRSGEMKKKPTPVMKVWKDAPDRIICKAPEYYPSRDRILENKWKNRGQKYYNQYEAPVTKLTNEREEVVWFLEHINYLFPNEGDAQWMLNWMAHLVKHPNIRYRVAPLSISTFHGTGRGWLGQVLHELVGHTNMTTIGNISEIVRDGAKNGFLHNSTLCVVSETYAGKKKYGVDNRLRQILGDNFQNVDIKFGEQKDKQIYTRLFFQSNHIDGLVIDELDTRIEVFINQKPPKNPEYYNRLYRLLDHPTFIDQVYSYLMDVDINTDWLKKSRRSDSRDTVIRATKSKTANAFYEFKLLVGEGFFTDKYLNDFLAEYMAYYHADEGGFGEAINNRELSYIKKEQTVMKMPIKLKGKQHTVKSFTHQNEVSTKHIVKSVKEIKAKIKLFFEQRNNGDQS